MVGWDPVQGLFRRLRHSGWVALKVLYWAATFQLFAGLRRRRYARLIRRAQLFDAAFYLSQGGDPRGARRDPIEHYLLRGAAAGLDPNRCFDTSWYLKRYPDVVKSGKNPLVHYIRYGAREGRATGPRFDTAYYLSLNPEVEGSALNPLAHYLLVGAARGLRCTGWLEEPQVPSEVPDPARYGARPGEDCALVVDQRILTPQEDSGSVRMFALLRLLRGMGVKVTFAADQTERNDASEQALRALGVELLFGREAIANHLQEEGRRYTVALLSRPEVASRYIALVRAGAVFARVVYDTVDLHWVRMAGAAQVKGDAALRSESERFRRLEAALARAADLAITVTKEEQRVLKQAVPLARVEVIPNVHAIRKGAHSSILKAQ